MTAEVEKRLERTIEDLGRILRRLARDCEIVGADGPLTKAYHQIIDAKTGIRLYVEAQH